MLKKKTPKKTPKKMGRPKIEIDFNVVRGMCAVMATEKEIANYFGCTIQTINERCKDETGCTFLDLFKKNSEAGKMSLRRSQFSNATKNNNATMQVWLGKQYLGQRDKAEVDLSSSDGSMSPKPAITAVDAIEAAKQYQKIMGTDE